MEEGPYDTSIFHYSSTSPCQISTLLWWHPESCLSKVPSLNQGVPYLLETVCLVSGRSLSDDLPVSFYRQNISAPQFGPLGHPRPRTTPSPRLRCLLIDDDLHLYGLFLLPFLSFRVRREKGVGTSEDGYGEERVSSIFSLLCPRTRHIGLCVSSLFPVCNPDSRLFVYGSCVCLFVNV